MHIFFFHPYGLHVLVFQILRTRYSYPLSSLYIEETHDGVLCLGSYCFVKYIAPRHIGMILLLLFLSS
uniref:Putative secreted protein n=1 Tax=Ixodes ricinus TaxID=34613 RepID=A0A6B0U1L9_IXORI